jgi:hypothetical protein
MQTDKLRWFGCILLGIGLFIYAVVTMFLLVGGSSSFTPTEYIRRLANITLFAAVFTGLGVVAVIFGDEKK